MRISFGRLGVRAIARDHVGTWTETGADEKQHKSPSDWVLFVLIPAGVGLVAALTGVRLYNVEAILAGAAILTGLLFGLLVHVLSLGLHLAGDENVKPGSLIARLTDQLRSNITWACAVGLVLTGFTAAVGALSRDLTQTGSAPWATGVITALGLHLGLTLLMILKRIRSTYRMTGKY